MCFLYAAFILWHWPTNDDMDDIQNVKKSDIPQVIIRCGWLAVHIVSIYSNYDIVMGLELCRTIISSYCHGFLGFPFLCIFSYFIFNDSNGGYADCKVNFLMAPNYSVTWQRAAATSWYGCSGYPGLYPVEYRHSNTREHLKIPPRLHFSNNLVLN